ncbi:hypothetical protein BLX24_30235 [Arsenicibacter rosenii]|uniref:Uncharacterized protein n=1 Tax=Arsenicibacter rosenii TaxID=1750698 RepID=A0A1S2V9T1_9BACT|nr:hypothetical protein BLX24_30235 [Arsenicibacter rosenii]
MNEEAIVPVDHMVVPVHPRTATVTDCPAVMAVRLMVRLAGVSTKAVVTTLLTEPVCVAQVAV